VNPIRPGRSGSAANKHTHFDERFRQGRPSLRAVTTPTIGGGSSFTFAQIALGGGWSSEIALGNTSTVPDRRIDFFRSDGVVASSMKTL
jgi:hypothetical protein